MLNHTILHHDGYVDLNDSAKGPVKKERSLKLPREGLTPAEAKRIDDERLAHRRLKAQTVRFLLREPRFVSPWGRLLEQPLYH